MNNLHRSQNILISNGAALPANDAASTAVTSGQIGIFGSDWTALNPAGGDTITTQPAIYIVEGKTDSDSVSYLKKSNKILGSNVTKYEAASYAPSRLEVWAIGHSRLTATGTIDVVDDTNYNFTIRFKNDKWNYSERPEVLNVNFTSAATGSTQFTIATQIASSINNSSFKSQIIAVVVGDGTGVYGLTSATDYGVEITSKEVNQFYATTYTPNKVYFSVHVNDASGFGASTTCTQIQSFSYGSGTYDQVYTMENKDFMNEGVVNRRQWPIPVLDYSASSTLVLSSAIAETVTGTISEDTVTFSGTVAAKLSAGDYVDFAGVNYRIKYFISTTVAVLTSVLLAGQAAAAVKVRDKYDLITIEFTDAITTPTGVVATANKSVVIAVPAIDTAGAYNSLSAAGQDVKDILDAWMTSTPGAFANISI